MVAQAYESVGVKHNPDLNSGTVLGYSEAVQSTYDGKRQWAANSYKIQSNVTIWTDTVAEKIIFDNDRAVGIQCSPNTALGSANKVTARKEILVCSGVQGSAKLLLLR
jgi:choline dehydrogenase-like flavoprotein